MIDKVTVNLYTCCKCDYQWISWDNKNKKESPIPVFCPHCKNVRWNQKYTQEEYNLAKKLQLEHVIRKSINPYKKESEVYEYDFIAHSFFFEIRPQPEMFELEQLAAIPSSKMEKKHDFMLSVIKDRINNAARYEQEHYPKYGKSIRSREKFSRYTSPVFPVRRRIMKGCKHKVIPEIEEALYDLSEMAKSFYNMWNNPVN